jgi:hypothetical protein
MNGPTRYAALVIGDCQDHSPGLPNLHSSRTANTMLSKKLIIAVGAKRLLKRAPRSAPRTADTQKIERKNIIELADI